MSDLFRPINANDVASSIEEVLLPRLTEALRDRVPGHCMRVLDLDSDLIAALAKALRSQATQTNVHVLTDDAVTADNDLYISSTKLVELRNPLPDGTLRPPLCVFLPANLRTSAEDSFGSATFEEFPVEDIYEVLLAAVAGTHSFGAARIRPGRIAVPPRGMLEVGGLGSSGPVPAVCTGKRQ